MIKLNSYFKKFSELSNGIFNDFETLPPAGLIEFNRKFSKFEFSEFSQKFSVLF